MTSNPFERIFGDPAARSNPRAWEALKNSKTLAVVWTAGRVWLGVMWLQAGMSKLWGSESSGFMGHNGAGVAGFAAHGIPAYTWWGTFLHHFVVPNAGWIGPLVAIAEFAIGLGLITGTLTRIAALGSLALLFTYVMSGTASVSALYALFAVGILTTWRTAGWIGVDGVIAGYRQRHGAQPIHLPGKKVAGKNVAGKKVAGTATPAAHAAA
jgi:thiosulfate dehydrogenase [quinone] large subunit